MMIKDHLAHFCLFICWFVSCVVVVCKKRKMYFIALSAVRITQAYLKCFWANFWQLVTEDNVYTIPKRNGTKQNIETMILPIHRYQNSCSVEMLEGTKNDSRLNNSRKSSLCERCACVLCMRVVSFVVCFFSPLYWSFFQVEFLVQI